MEFIIGIYDVDRSGDTDKIRMRGSGKIVGSSAKLLGVGGCVIRLMSILSCVKFQKSCNAIVYLQQSAFVMAPTNAHGAEWTLR